VTSYDQYDTTAIYVTEAGRQVETASALAAIFTARALDGKISEMVMM
jgi:hypothetical protein